MCMLVNRKICGFLDCWLDKHDGGKSFGAFSSILLHLIDGPISELIKKTVNRVINNDDNRSTKCLHSPCSCSKKGKENVRYPCSLYPIRTVNSKCRISLVAAMSGDYGRQQGGDFYLQNRQEVC